MGGGGMTAGVERISIKGRCVTVYLKMHGKPKFETRYEIDRFTHRSTPQMYMNVGMITYHWTLKLFLVVIKPLVRLGVVSVTQGCS
jgi:hypothetical protein